MRSTVRTCTFFLVFCLLLLAAKRYDGYAFYLESDESHVSSFQLERISKFSPKRSGVLAVSDNYSYVLEKHGQRPVIHRSSDRFAAMDLIEINLPVSIAFYRPGSLDNNLSDIFYADLKLKKLQEEYKRLQERARKLLAELGVSPAGLVSDPGGTQHQDQPLKRPPIFAAKNKLMREHANITKAIGSTSSLHLDSRKALVVASAGLASILKQSSKGIEPDFDTQIGNGHMTRGYSIRFSHEETYFDKLIGKLFETAAYILSHKLEALFLLLSLLILLKIVASART